MKLLDYILHVVIAVVWIGTIGGCASVFAPPEPHEFKHGQVVPAPKGCTEEIRC